MPDSWKTVIKIPDEMSAGDLKKLCQRMREQRGVTVRTSLGEGWIAVVIDPGGFWLSYNAPPGSHSFAQGWVLFSVALGMAKLCKQSLDFQRVEWSNQSFRVLKHQDDGIRIHQDGSFDYLVGFKSEDGLKVKEPPHPAELAA